MSVSIKIRVSGTEDALIRATAASEGVTISLLVKSVILDTLERRLDKYDVPDDLHAARPKGPNVRIPLTADHLLIQRQIGHGLEFAPWARLVLLDAIRTGRAQELVRKAAAVAP